MSSAPDTFSAPSPGMKKNDTALPAGRILSSHTGIRASPEVLAS